MILVDNMLEEPRILTHISMSSVNTRMIASEEFALAQLNNLPWMPIGVGMAGIVGMMTRDLWFPFLLHSGEFTYRIVQTGLNTTKMIITDSISHIVHHVCYLWDVARGVYRILSHRTTTQE